MKKIKTVLNLLKHDPKSLISAMGRNNLLNWIPEKGYLEIMFYCETGKKLNLRNPVAFNEKLQWLKLYDRKVEYTTYVDKFAVRDYIKTTIGEEYLIPLIGVYDNVDEIPWIDLPREFVLKCTHGSGCNIICKNKNKLDIRAAKKQLRKWLNTNYYYSTKEWPYKDVKPRIICEKYMVDESGTELKDYKFYCFNGKPKLIQVMSGRHHGNYFINHFDLEWISVTIKRKTYKENPVTLKRPEKLKDMIRICEELSTNIPYVRIDLYYANDKIFFGEITFFPVSGYIDFENDEEDCLLGSYIKLPTKN